MSRANALIKRISKAIKKVGPLSRTSYLRTVTLSGGDALIGRGNAVSNSDVKFDPQPYYRQLGHRQAMYMSTASLQLVADDYKFTFPVTQVSQASFQGVNVFIVLKDGNGEERLRILYIATEDFGGKDLIINVFARSMGH